MASVRARDGIINEFDVPGAGNAPGQGTFAWTINPAGVAAAGYIDADGLEHGYVRASNGTITRFDVPGAGTGPGQGTIPLTINPAGVITGVYFDSGGVIHGFLRIP